MRIIGIDPSLCKTGWGVIEYNDKTFSYISNGIIKPKVTLPTEQRLSFLGVKLMEIILEYRPNCAAIEDTFCGINPLTNLRLGFASGALMCICGMTEIPVNRYPARLVKQIIGHNGASDKFTIRKYVIDLLKLDTIIGLDSSDALAVAMTHALLIKSEI